MSIDDLENLLSGQCRTTVKYLAELHFGQDKGHGQHSDERRWF